MWSRPGCWPPAGKGKPKLQTHWSTRKCFAPAQCICQQEPIQCRMMIQQHRREACRILHGLEKFHHYCFVCEVHVIIGHKPLVAIMGKDVSMLSQCLWCIILCIHQYRVHILYKPGPKLYIADWVSCHKHEENKDRDTRSKHRCKHYQHNNRPTNVHTHTRHTRSNSPRCTPTRSQSIYHKLLAT